MTWGYQSPIIKLKCVLHWYFQTAKMQIAKQNVIDHHDEISYQEEVVDLKHRWVSTLKYLHLKKKKNYCF